MLHPIPLKLPLTAQAVLAAPFRFLTGPQLGHTVDGPRRNTYAAQQRSRRDLPAACVPDDSAWHCALTAEQVPLRPQCRDRLCVQRYAGMSGSAIMTAGRSGTLPTQSEAYRYLLVIITSLSISSTQYSMDAQTSCGEGAKTALCRGIPGRHGQRAYLAGGH